MLIPKLLFGVVLAFEAGIFFASFFSSSPFLILGVFLAGILLVSVFWQRFSLVRMGLLLLAAALGMSHYAGSAQLPASLVEPKEVSFEGKVMTFPEKNEEGMRLTLETENLEGRVLLFISSFQEFRQGDKVQVTGKLQSPSAFEGFNYPLYLAKDGILFVMFQPSVEVKERREPVLSLLKERLQRTIDSSLPLPESSLLSAMLLGNKAGLPEELKEDLNITGTRHITAISGMHVAILSGMLFVFLLNVGMPKKKSSLLVLLFLVFFVVFTGFQTSALRAGIMGSSLLFSGLLGRRNGALRALVFAGGALLFFNPLLLAYDIGFQLSFLAVLGILLFLPLLQYFFRKTPNPFGLRDVAFMSVAAQVFTLPLVLYHFGILSFVSLVSNLLVVPLLPLVLFLGVVFFLVSMVLPFLSGLLALPLGLLLSYLSFVVTAFSELPFAAQSVEGFSLWGLLPFMVAAAFFAWRFQQQRRFQFSEETMLIWKI
ncbi:MAG: ComEC/Rec2 family competence protein [bacterium]|nr:ComEC/Rec2 family competence protein [bacterium]